MKNKKWEKKKRKQESREKKWKQESRRKKWKKERTIIKKEYNQAKKLTMGQNIQKLQNLQIIDNNIIPIPIGLV